MTSQRNKIKIKWVIGTLLLLITSVLWADDEPNFPCQLRLIKTNCWKGYQVSVQPIDTMSQTNIGKPIVLDKDTSEIMQTFSCQSKQTLSFAATVSPAVWESPGATAYPSVNFFQAPSRLPLHADKWVVSLCFAQDFSSVPLPLTTSSTCDCQFSELPNSKKSVSEALAIVKNVNQN